MPIQQKSWGTLKSRVEVLAELMALRKDLINAQTVLPTVVDDQQRRHYENVIAHCEHEIVTLEKQL